MVKNNTRVLNEQCLNVYVIRVYIHPTKDERNIVLPSLMSSTTTVTLSVIFQLITGSGAGVVTGTHLLLGCGVLMFA